MDTATATSIAAALNNEALTRVHYSNSRTVRDQRGNLRELSEAETTFIAAIRTEMKLRGLI